MTVRGRLYERFPARCSLSGVPIVRYQEVRCYGSVTGIDPVTGKVAMVGAVTYGDGTPVPKGAPGPWASPAEHPLATLDRIKMGTRSYTREKRTNRDQEVEMEIRKFRAEGKPHMAALLEAAHPETPEALLPDTLFPLGEVSITYTLGNLLNCRGDELSSLIVRHSEGDFGEIGRHDETPPPDEGDSWSDGLLADLATRNAVSIAKGAGCIRSSFDLYDPDAHDKETRRLARIPGEVVVSPRRRNKEDRCYITTILTPDHPPMTFVYSNKDNITV